MSRLPVTPAPTQRLWWLGIALLALCVRLAHLLDSSRLPIFERPSADAALYLEAARNFANGAFPDVFFKPPLYPVVLAMWWKLVGTHFLLLRLPMVLAGVATTMITCWLGRRLFGPAAGIVAGIFYALHASAVYFEAELLEVGLVTTIQLGALGATLWAHDKHSTRGVLIAAALLGLGCVARPTFLLFSLVALAWLRARWAVVAFAVAIAPVTLHNAVRGHDFVLVSANVGVNAHIGNNPQADGRIGATSDLPAQPAAAERTANVLAEAAAGKTLRPSQVSNYWLGRAARYAISHPGHTLRLLMRKLFYAWNGAPISDNEDLLSLRRYLRIYPWLPIDMWFLAPIGLVGIIACGRRNAAVRLAATFVALQLGALLPFFIVERFRLPWAPVLCVFAAGLCTEIAPRLRQRQRAWPLLGASLAALGLCNIPALGVRQPLLFDLDYRIAYAYQEKGNIAAAMRAYRAAVDSNPQAALARNALGYLLAEQRMDLDEAVQLIEAALRLDPSHAAHYYDSLAFAHLQRGDAERALLATEQGLRQSRDAETRETLLARRAKAFAAMGNAAAERAALLQLLETSPTSKQADAARQRLQELPAETP